VRRAITVLAVVALLAGPAAVVAWLLVGAAAILSPDPLPRGRGGRLALAGLVLLTAWTGASIAWAPLSAPATDALQRLLLYVAILAAAAALLREPLARRLTEPALALGTLVAVGYGLSERLLPGVFELMRSTGALGRLEQPLTYWNAMGALAALGALLSARIAGDYTRPRHLRAAATAAAVPLALGVSLSYSRGVWAALGVGLLALAALALTRAQLRALAVVVAAGLIAGIAANGLDGVRALEGSAGARESDGLVMLAILAALCATAAGATWLLARAEESGRISPARIPLPRAVTVVIAMCLVAVAAGVIAYAARDRGHPAVSGASPERLRSLESNRYEYWKVALEHGFADHPLKGTGSGGFAVIWLQHRDVPERAKVAHSLYVETLAELGLVGLALLAMFLAGIAIAAARALRLDPAQAAGPAAALILWAAHSAVDWDWQMPALTLVVLVLAGLLIAQEEPAS
jgi:hypothetical protein